jgi:hypothetical protein
MKEIWKDIEGFEGLYKISNLGNVYSIHLSKERQQHLNNDGYLAITLGSTEKKTRTSKLVHRLVALHFLDNDKDYKEVNHIDGNKLNNRIDNLEWCNRSMNCQHAYDTGLNPKCFGEKNGRAKLTEVEVKEIKSLAYKVSGKELAKKYNIGFSMIYRIWQNKFWKYL